MKTINPFKSPELAAIIGLISVMLIYALSFPKIELDYAMGLDNSYYWALNHLFYNDYDQLIQLQYPFGPLTLLKVPSTDGYNLEYFLIFFTFVKILFLSLFLRFGYLTHSKSFVGTILLALLIGLFSDIDFLIIGNIALLLLFALRDSKFWYFLLATALATIGLFIKSSIGIISFSMFPVVFYIFQKNLGKVDFQLILGSVLVFLGLGWLVFGNFGLLKDYCFGVIYLAGGYSGLASFPKNNWWMLSLFIGSIAIFPLLYQETKGRQAFFTLLLPLFFMWKHAMSREDYGHNAILFGFLILFWGIIFIASKRKTIALFIIASVSFFSFHHNMTVIPGFRKISIETQGVKYFSKWIFHTQKAKKADQKRMKQNFVEAKLDQELLDIIAKKTIDFFPWELTYAEANQLHWQPRKTLQSGHFSHWFDQTTAQELRKESKPEFILFHLLGNQLNSLDEAHLLNDGPLVIKALFDGYQPTVQKKDLILYQKTSQSRLTTTDWGTNQLYWNQWISVPQNTESITRAKVKFQESIALQIKSFLFKGQPYFIDYLTKEHALYTYRFTPSNAEDGLWINPLFMKPTSPTPTPIIQQIRLRTIDTSLVSVPWIQWERITLNSSTDPDDIFGKTTRKETVLLDTILPQGAKISQPIFLEKCDVSTAEYSHSIKFLTEDYWTQSIDSLHIRYQSIHNEPINTGTVIAYSMDDSPNDFWQTKKLLTRFKGDWNFTQESFILTKEKYPTGKCTIVLWNPDQNPIQISEARLIISAL